MGPQSRSGSVRKLSLPPGFDPRTAQPVASRYTDYAVPAQQNAYKYLILYIFRAVIQRYLVVNNVRHHSLWSPPHKTASCLRQMFGNRH
jgi:hypothetical protein